MTDVETQDRYIALLLRSGEPEEHAGGSGHLHRGRSGRPHVRRRQSGSVALSIGDRVVETVRPRRAVRRDRRDRP